MKSAIHSTENEDTLHVFQTARETLGPTLGASECVSDKEGVYLDFHSRAYDYHETEE